MTTNTETAFRTSITVKAPIERAFTVFTAGFDTWWPRVHHIGPVDLVSVTMEAGVGGRWFERRVDGSECDWGRVLAWEPPHRVTLSWQINSEWEVDPDLEKPATVDVRFIAEGETVTRVEFEHRGLDGLGDTWENVLRDVSSKNGWSGILQDFAGAFTT
ncbi:MAG: SRPBCC family protein [Candidatus Dormiibacterota bacterium]